MHLYTAIVAAPLALLYFILGLSISMKRLGGASDSEESFKRLIRVHGNAAEHIPIVLVLLLLLELELVGAPSTKCWIFGVGLTFVGARLLHAAGYVVRRRHLFHLIGSTVTYFVEAGLAGLLAWFYCCPPGSA